MFFNKNKIIKKTGSNLNKSLPILSICDLKKEFCLELLNHFKEFDQVELIKGDIFKVKADAIVSPANSFGDMSGGLDKLIDDHYKGKAQEKVIHRIREEYYGELPVGAILIIPINSGKFPYLIVAPTMRIPGRLRKETINVYLAMRGILSQVLKYNELNNGVIKKVLLPGLGIGVGGLGYEESAKQMYRAYQNVFEEEWRGIVHPALAPYVLRK